ncbi:hypothetical protein NOMA109596_06780 [Nocardioides marinus]
MSPTSGPLPSLSSIADAVLVSSIAGTAVMVVVVESLEVTLAPPGAVPVAVAVLSRLPASTSACVSVYVALVQVTDVPGASAPTGQVTLGDVAPRSGSWTATGFSVTVPVLVTLNE